MLRYLFVDMNSYFASVEQQERPELRDRPVGIVPMPVESTCCIAASYEAKRFGVKTGTPVREAKQRCPDLVLVEARPMVYVQYHHRLVEAVESCLHVDEVRSIDEMHGRLMGREREPEQAAALAHQVKQAVGLAGGPWIRCSVGLAPNPWLAKVASDMRKPDGLTMLLAEQLPEKLYDLDLTDLPGIAKGMVRRLSRHGVETVEQLAALSEADLSQIWESRALGALWWAQLHGVDLPPRPTQRRTVGHSHVLPPQWRTEAGARAVLIRMIHKAGSRLRRLGYYAAFLTLSVEHGPHGSQSKWERRASLGCAMDTPTMLRAFAELWPDRPRATPMKVAVVLTHLVHHRQRTLPLFPTQNRLERLCQVMDRIDAKYGRHTLYFAPMCGAEESAPARISFTQIPDLDEF